MFTPVSVQSTVRFPGVDELWLDRWDLHGMRLDEVADAVEHTVRNWSLRVAVLSQSARDYSGSQPSPAEIGTP